MKIVIPNKLEEITLEQYVRYEEVLTADLSPAELILKRIGIFCRLDYETVKGMDINDILDINTILNDTLMQDTPFVSIVKIDGKKYGFIPNLDKMSFGEYIDLDTNSQKKDLVKLFSILYRPVVEEFDDMYRIAPYTSEEDTSIIEKMPLSVVNGALVFFSHLRMDLLKATLNFLMKKLKEMTRKKQILDENGVGIQAYMDSVMEKYGELEQLQK